MERRVPSSLPSPLLLVLGASKGLLEGYVRTLLRIPADAFSVLAFPLLFSHPYHSVGSKVRPWEVNPQKMHLAESPCEASHPWLFRVCSTSLFVHCMWCCSEQTKCHILLPSNVPNLSVTNIGFREQWEMSCLSQQWRSRCCVTVPYKLRLTAQQLDLFTEEQINRRTPDCCLPDLTS